MSKLLNNDKRYIWDDMGKAAFHPGKSMAPTELVKN